MLKEDIEEALGDIWDYGSIAAKEKFIEAMEGRQYGYDALSHAWLWFLVGWGEAGGQAVEDADNDQ